jgi:hypothetical protein
MPVAALLCSALSASNASGQRVFFGNLHSHTSYSDGTGTPSRAYRHARDAARLDFLAITEHNHAGAEFGAGERADGRLIGTDHRLYSGPQNSALIPSANRYNEDGRFVAIYGQEFSTIGKGNHVNVFDVDRVIEVSNGEFAELIDWLEDHPDGTGHPAVLQFNHPALHSTSKEYGADDFGSEENWIAMMGRHASLIEVLNGPAMESSAGHRAEEVMEEDFFHYLNVGFHLAPTGDQDNHYATWGTVTDVRTAVIADELTRAKVMGALRNRHVYASEDRNLELIFRVGGHLTGDIVRDPPAIGSELPIELTIRDADEPNAQYTVSVFADDKAGGEPARFVTSRTVQGDTPAGTPLRIGGVRYSGPGQYVLLKVRQRSGVLADRAWTAPVWFEP